MICPRRTVGVGDSRFTIAEWSGVWGDSRFAVAKRPWGAITFAKLGLGRVLGGEGNFAAEQQEITETGEISQGPSWGAPVVGGGVVFRQDWIFFYF